MLTPVFGVDFPSICLKPEDSAFLKLSIDKDVIRRCTEQAYAVRKEPPGRSILMGPSNIRPASPAKAIWPKSATKLDYESGYYTDTDRSTPSSPQSGSEGFKAVNAPRSLRLDDNGAWLANNRGPSHDTSIEAALPITVDQTPQKRVREEQRGALVSSPTEQPPDKRMRFSTMGEEARAAYTLLQLHLADAALAEKNRMIDRRASN